VTLLEPRRKTRTDPMELAQRLSTEGGFSISDAGRPARSGVMVARRGSEETVPGLATASDIEGYQRRHAADVGRRGYYMGAWVEGDEPKRQTVFDISQRFPREHREAAMLQGAVHGQRMLFDVDRGDVTPSAHVPGENVEQTGQQILPFSRRDIDAMDIKDVRYPQRRTTSQVLNQRDQLEAAARERVMMPKLGPNDQLPAGGIADARPGYGQMMLPTTVQGGHQFYPHPRSPGWNRDYDEADNKWGWSRHERAGRVFPGF
jgi:hypothetical protein